MLPSLWEGLGEGVATAKEEKKTSARVLSFSYRP